MASGGEDQMSNKAENVGDSSSEKETVKELKAKIQNQSGGDSMVNNVHQAEQNGHANLPNDVDKKSESSSSKHHSSSSKHSSSKSKEGSSSNSSKHKEGQSSSSKHGSSSSKHREHGSSSSSSKHKDGSSSSSSKHKEGSSSSSSKHKDGSSSSSSKHKEGSSSSSSKHKDGSSSSSNKHREGSSHKEGSSSSSKHKEGSSSSKHHSSSSSSKHKDGSSSSSKHKEGSSSSSSKHSSSDKHKSSSSSKDGEKSKSSHSSDKHKSSSSSKHRDHSPSKSAEGIDKKEVVVKKEASSPSKSANEEVVVKKEMVSPSKSANRKSPEKAPKEEPISDDDVPLSARLQQQEKAVKRPADSDDDDDVPLSSRLEKVKKVKKEAEETKPKKGSAKKRKQDSDYDDDDDDYEEKPKKKKKKVKNEKSSGKSSATPAKSPTKGKGKVKDEEPQEVWRWWEEERRDDGVKWTFLEHKGPVFAPDYEPLPEDIRFYYDGKEMKLSEGAEEVATFYAKMLEHDYTTRDVFNNNFMKDWRKVMTSEEREKIKDLKKCNFNEMAEYFKQLSEERKNRTKEQKKKLKEENEAIQKEYGFCTMDGHKEKIGNFRIEPPGLFRGRGDHPKQGMLKTRTLPEDVIINCSKDSKVPEPPKGHKWKEVRNDNKVSWLACWNENIQGSTKYVMLNAASRLKGEKDWQKYETARRLHKKVDKIRAQYREDWKSKEMRIRQRAVALYFIDKLALRAGNEKEEGETADTVGCCSLRKEHLTLHEKYEDQEYVVEFDFLGKDSIRYYNRVTVEKRVFKNLQLFMENKAGEDDIFDRLNTTVLNKHLQELMEGLTAKVFRTYNASHTLQEQLNQLTGPEDPIPAKILSYNRANRAVAVLCNHQRAAPKNFSKQMENLQTKIDDKKAAIKEAKKLMKDAKSDYKNHKSEKTKSALEKRKKTVQRLEEQLTKLEVQATDKEENKEIALGTSKLNYLDPRISVAWCKKWEVPVEKIYNKTQREKFRWAIDMAEADFEF